MHSLNYRIKKSKRSDFEQTVLTELLSGGDEGVHAAEYLLDNNVSFDGLTYQPFGTGAGWNPDGTISFPDNNGALPYPNDWVVSLIAHEAMHLEQGSFVALTAYGELQAWQVGFRVLDALNGPAVGLSETQQAIVDLPLTHDPLVLQAAVTLMLENQDGKYLGGYLLYFTIPVVPMRASRWPQ